MNHAGLISFINEGVGRWEGIRKGLSGNKEMAAFLKKSYPVVVFDHHQLDMDFAKNLYKPLTGNWQKASMEEQKKEDFRKKMLLHLEKDLKELSLEIRFQYLDIGLIQELKSQPEIKDLNSASRAGIRVLVCYCKLQANVLQKT